MSSEAEATSTPAGLMTPLHHRLLLHFRTTSALHPGSGEDRGTTDSGVTLDGTGRPVLRGTAIAGALVHELARPGLFTEPELTLLFGGIGDVDGPSIVATSDSALRNVVLERREGVGIDRVTGTAAPGIKFDTEVIARGAVFTLELRALTSDRDDDTGRVLVEECFATIVGRAERGTLRFGGRTTRGFGGAVLTSSEYATVNDRTDLLGASKAIVLDEWPEPVAISRAPRVATAGVVRFRLPLEPRLAVFSKNALHTNLALPQVASSVAADGDGGPLRSLSLLLAGSSLKGSLRSAAEYRVRTVCSLDTQHAHAAVRHADQLRVPGIDDLFGWSSDAAGEGRVGAVSVDDCYGRRALPPDTWAEIVRVALDSGGREDRGEPDARTSGFESDQEPDSGVEAGGQPVGPGSANAPSNAVWVRVRSVLNENGLESWRTYVHNRINEVTGGVHDQTLFSSLIPIGERFDALTVTLDLRRIAPEVRTAMTGLLLLVLRDAAAGEIGFGWGTSNGFGHLRPRAAVSAEIVDADPVVFPGHGAGDVFDPFADGDLLDRCDAALGDWFDTAVTAPTGPDDPQDPVASAKGPHMSDRPARPAEAEGGNP